MIAIFDISDLVIRLREVIDTDRFNLKQSPVYIIPNSERDLKEFLLWSFRHFFEKNGFRVMEQPRWDAYIYIYDEIASFLEEWMISYFDKRGLLNRDKSGVLSFLINHTTLIISEEFFNFW